MAASHGNLHILTAAEAEDLKARGKWEAFVLCVSALAEILPATGAPRIQVASGDRYMTSEVIHL